MLNQEILPKYQVETGSDIPEWMINEAHLISEALDKGTIHQYEAEYGIIEDKEILDVMHSLVNVTYFVEYPPETVAPEKRGDKLLELFHQPTKTEDGREIALADYLAENGQAVSLAMITLDDSTAEAVRYLNEKKVPVIGWVVVEDVEGYWTNRTNMTETIQKTEAVKQWAKENDLDLIGLGFDIEKPLQYLSALSRFNVIELMKEIRNYRRKKEDREPEGDAQFRYRDLIKSVKAEGFETDVYSMPKYTKRILGDMDVRTADRNIEMVYTSTMPASRLAMKVMRSEGAIPAFGLVTGKEDETPGRDLTGGKLPKHLTPEELQADIRTVLDQEIDLNGRKFNLRDLYLFALNDARVALMMTAAVDKAFDSKLPKQ